MVRKRSLLRRLSPIKLVLKECGGLASFSQPEWLPKASGEAGVEAEGTPRHPLHHLLLDRKCVMEWEEPHDSTLYCLQTDGNHLLATGSSEDSQVPSLGQEAGLRDARARYPGLHWEWVCLGRAGGSLE